MILGDITDCKPVRECGRDGCRCLWRFMFAIEKMLISGLGNHPGSSMISCFLFIQNENVRGNIEKNFFQIDVLGFKERWTMLRRGTNDVWLYLKPDVTIRMRDHLCRLV